MRPYNTNRNPELSQPVSSEENTLAEKTHNANASFDILRSLSESISVDCGSFEISSPAEYYQTSSVPSSVPSQVAFVDPTGAEIRTPVESVTPTPVKNEPAKVMQTLQKSSVNEADMDDDDYDCMNDPNYRAQSQNDVNAPSFDELMARTAESIAKMRQETDRVGSQVEMGGSGNSLSSRSLDSASNAVLSNSETRKQDKAPKTEKLESQQRNENENNASQPEAQSDVSVDTSKKSFFSKFSWSNMRKTLFSKETIKLVLLSVAISALIVSAVIYKNSPKKDGLQESEDVVINQAADAISDESVQSAENSGIGSNTNSPFPASNFSAEDSTVIPSPKALTDQIRNDYQSPSFEPEPMEFEYSQNDPGMYPNSEDSGRQLASPHSVNYGNHVADSVPDYPAGPQYADVAPAFGSQYIPDEYASPVLEDDSVSGYSETGYNSNYMR